MSTPSKRLTQILKRSVTPLLLKEGFTKRGLNYAKSLGEISWVINVQKSRWNTKNESQFTLNCGVHIPNVVSKYVNQPEPETPDIAHCCVSARYGLLTPPYLDKWWTLKDADIGLSDDSQIEEELKIALNATIFPFLQRFTTVDCVIDFFKGDRSSKDRYVTPNDVVRIRVYLAILYSIGRKHKECHETLSAAERLAIGRPDEEYVRALHSRICNI